MALCDVIVYATFFIVCDTSIHGESCHVIYIYISYINILYICLYIGFKTGHSRVGETS